MSNIDPVFNNIIKNWIPPVVQEKPKPAPKIIKEGDILVMQWGYEANNVNFFKVLKRTKTQVVIAELESIMTQPYPCGCGTHKYVTAGDSWKSWSLWANRDGGFIEHNYDGPTAFRRKVKTNSYQNEIVWVTDYAYAYLWDGDEVEDYNHH